MTKKENRPSRNNLEKPPVKQPRSLRTESMVRITHDNASIICTVVNGDWQDSDLTTIQKMYGFFQDRTIKWNRHMASATTGDGINQLKTYIVFGEVISS